MNRRTSWCCCKYNDLFHNMWVFPKIGVPQNGWFIVEIHIKMDDLGVPPFLETLMCSLDYHFFRTQQIGLAQESPSFRLFPEPNFGLPLVTSKNQTFRFKCPEFQSVSMQVSQIGGRFITPPRWDFFRRCLQRWPCSKNSVERWRRSRSHWQRYQNAARIGMEAKRKP